MHRGCTRASQRVRDCGWTLSSDWPPASEGVPLTSSRLWWSDQLSLFLFHLIRSDTLGFVQNTHAQRGGGGRGLVVPFYSFIICQSCSSTEAFIQSKPGGSYIGVEFITAKFKTLLWVSECKQVNNVLTSNQKVDEQQNCWNVDYVSPPTTHPNSLMTLSSSFCTKHT